MVFVLKPPHRHPRVNQRLLPQANQQASPQVSHRTHPLGSRHRCHRAGQGLRATQACVNYASLDNTHRVMGMPATTVPREASLDMQEHITAMNASGLGTPSRMGCRRVIVSSWTIQRLCRTWCTGRSPRRSQSVLRMHDATVSLLSCACCLPLWTSRAM